MKSQGMMKRYTFILSQFAEETHEPVLIICYYFLVQKIDPALLRLPAAMLRGTFAGAYNLLTKLVSKIGWDELLRCRSLVFVMEEEYRAQKEAEEEFRKKSRNNVYAPVSRSSEKPKLTSQHLDPNSTSVPTIKVSTESERDREEAEEKAKEENDSKDDADQSMKDVPLDDLSLDDQKDHLEDDNKEDPQGAVSEETRKPEEVHEGSEAESEKDIEISFSFSHKRLCDRWLDNLFMVLYEDLRQYAVWRAEVQHYRQARILYRKSGGEWQIYGDLAMRLHHRIEALEAYQECVAKKFSPKALYQLLELYADDGQVLKAMDAAIRLCVYQERWYQEAVVGFPNKKTH